MQSDNSAEFVFRAILNEFWPKASTLIRNGPEKPWQNDASDSFNGKFRDQCLNLEWFRNLMDAKIPNELWRLQ